MKRFIVAAVAALAVSLTLVAPPMVQASVPSLSVKKAKQVSRTMILRKYNVESGTFTIGYCQRRVGTQSVKVECVANWQDSETGTSACHTVRVRRSAAGDYSWKVFPFKG